MHTGESKSAPMLGDGSAAYLTGIAAGRGTEALTYILGRQAAPDHGATYNANATEDLKCNMPR